MRAGRVASAVVGIALALALTGCGSTESSTPQPAQSDDRAAGSAGGEKPRAIREEKITPGGIAGIVLEHVGPDAVRRFITFESEPGSVSLSVRLRDRVPHNFIISAYSPVEAEQLGEAGQCPSEPEGEDESQCRTLDDGTTVVTTEHAEAFSDDNEDGMYLSGRAVTPEDGAVLAVFESYDDSPAVSVSDLEELLTDPRLAWFTDPAVNEAGAEIDVRFMD